MALALGEQRNQDIGPRHLVSPGILDVQDRTLDDALKTRGGLGVLAILDDKGHQVVVDIFAQGLPENLAVDVTGLQHLGRVRVVDQGQKQVFERRVFVVAIAREFDGAVQGLFQASRECRHRLPTPFPWCIVKDADVGARIQ